MIRWRRPLPTSGASEMHNPRRQDLPDVDRIRQWKCKIETPSGQTRWPKRWVAGAERSRIELQPVVLSPIPGLTSPGTVLQAVRPAMFEGPGLCAGAFGIVAQANPVDAGIYGAWAAVLRRLRLYNRRAVCGL